MASFVIFSFENHERYKLLNGTHEIGRNWLKSDDDQISTKHVILKVINAEIVVKPTENSLVFYRLKYDQSLRRIKQNNAVLLKAGDSFGLLPNRYWFRLENKEKKVDEENKDHKSIERNVCPLASLCPSLDLQHFSFTAHPGDVDYRMPEYAKFLPNKPQCRYGQNCYRRNVHHFDMFSHFVSAKK